MPPLLTEAKIEKTRARIVRVAEHQAVALGLERVSMHSIAKEFGWSATALYRYFEDKDAILAAARAAGLDRFSAALDEALEGPGDIWDRSRAIGNAYVTFAFENPDAYKLMFAVSQPDMERYPEVARAQARARAHMTRYVTLMVEEGGLDADPVVLGHLFWAGMHGLISLRMAGQLRPDSPDFEVLRRELVRSLVRGASPRAAIKQEEA